MTKVQLFLIGEYDSKVFINGIDNDPIVIDELKNSVPSEAINCPDHPLWKHISYEFLRRNDFDLCKAVNNFKKDNSISDTLNIFGTIKKVYEYLYPDMKMTDIYSERVEVYLDSIQDCFEGFETRHLTEYVINECLKIPGKTARSKTAKAKIKELFHVDGRKRPYWIQGPEWPMGQNSPMKYMKTEHRGEEVNYYFVDVDTETIRIVTQYY